MRHCLTSKALGKISPLNVFAAALSPLSLRGEERSGGVIDMKYEFQNNKYKELRKKLRNNATHAEIILWNHLKNKRLNGHKFIRQYGAGRYILDFYCPQVRLAIELDGGHHAELENEINDAIRTAYLKERGIHVIRFWNSEVIYHLRDVLITIGAELSRNGR